MTVSRRKNRTGGSRARAPADALDALQCIDTLTVGPVVVEKRRLIAPYTVKQRGKAHTFELIYRWEEDVFDPEEPEAQNLAALVAAQVALNYGLFCKRIVFRGPFDRHDRQFLADMAKNTAREIFVKKILEPNEFLLPPAMGLPAVRRESYLRAELDFPDEPFVPSRGARGGHAGSGSHAARRWSSDASRHAVLSSGGKDSLLSWGLLNELGLPTDAIYINESGRHWFTALNAYRHFEQHVPGTARVWTNSDRLFPWMLRRMPFIRQNFQEVRSDEYPIRLWTVAVFLFGALPLLRRRGIGRLIIGDEYDTSRRAVHAGIRHYDGLYDQSRWFDNALSRYFARKGWGVCQFSILRPMSELVIQTMLVQRYPELQREQVSCHAAHSVEGRVLPCGACEKCRRIVGMLLGVGADPARCGYTQAQVEACLAVLAKKGVAQEAECAEHVLWLLQERGLWKPTADDVSRARPRPEAVKLRFDPERAPMDDIPVDLREPLYRIALQYAEGALRKHGRLWIDIDPLSDPELMTPYPFEAKLPAQASIVPPVKHPASQRARLLPASRAETSAQAAGAPTTPAGSATTPAPAAATPTRAAATPAAATGAPAAATGAPAVAAAAPDAAGATAPLTTGRPSGARPWMLGELTWPDAQKRFREVDIALLPVGSIEQHGPHLPLDVDSFDAEYFAQAVGAACRAPHPLVLPLIPYGVAYHHDDFPGTISVGPDTLSAMVREVGMSVARHGITKLIIINGHGGNRPCLRFAAQQINRDAKIFTCVETGETADADLAEMIETDNDVHAGEIETSTTLALRPHLVRMDKAKKFVPKFSSGYLDFTSKRSVEWFARTSAISKSGIMGDPTRASIEKGQRMWEVMIRNMVEFVEELKGMSLDEIYQKRY